MRSWHRDRVRCEGFRDRQFPLLRHRDREISDGVVRRLPNRPCLSYPNFRHALDPDCSGPKDILALSVFRIGTPGHLKNRTVPPLRVKQVSAMLEHKPHNERLHQRLVQGVAIYLGGPRHEVVEAAADDRVEAARRCLAIVHAYRTVTTINLELPEPWGFKFVLDQPIGCAQSRG
jgi:hypothetical protein